ncbi:transmembrane protein 44-like [Glandiceps talaboti]
MKFACCRDHYKHFQNSCAESLWKRRRRQESEQVYCFVIPWIVCGVYFISNYNPEYSTNHYNSIKTGRVLLAIMEGENGKIGYSLGICASIFYWLSRFPTICDIYASVSLPSWKKVFFHLFCVLGGLTYSIAIVTQSLQLEFIIHALPWLLGSLGLAGLDLGIMIQMIVNRKTDGKNTVSNVISLLREDEVENDAPTDEVNSEWIAIKPMNNKYLKQATKSGQNLEELETLQKKTRDKKTGLLVDVGHDDGYLAEREDSEDDETVHFQLHEDPASTPPRVIIKDTLDKCDASDSDLEWEDFKGAPATLTVESTTKDTKKWSSDDLQVSEFGASSNVEAEKKWFDDEWRSKPEADWDF